MSAASTVAAAATIVRSSIAVAALLVAFVSYGAECKNLNSVGRCVGEELKSCRCDDVARITEVYCRSVGLTVVPASLPSSLIKL